MLYPKNRAGALDDALFAHPTSEYRGTPFWAWNGRLENNTLDWQIGMFEKMGMGGFHMHVRTGMDSPYLDGEFMGFVRHCVEQAKARGMLAWLYDEDRWPSGTAGGKVTAKKPAYAMKALLFTARPRVGPPSCPPPRADWGQKTMRRDNGELIAVYDVSLRPDGTLNAYRRIEADAPEKGVKWYAYVEHATDDPWFNDHPYVDTLSEEAVASFIDITHRAYARALQADFGRAVPAIFTDEPKVTAKIPLSYAQEQSDVFFPWTDALPALFREAFGEDVLDRLPELVWELPDGALSEYRYNFHNLVANRFASSYCVQIGAWCDAHGLMLTGHLYGEPTLERQTNAVGEAMRCYPSFTLPGIDMLCDRHEYNTAKQAQSIVRQSGREGMLSELYGVTGWDYDFRGHKLQGDWQAALGVTVRVPHLAWMTMKGEAKRDFPACIGYQSPWWDQYALVEDHFARLNTALTRGRPVAKVAVIHPIESYWLYWGPSEQTAALRGQLEAQFAQLTEYLLFGLIDFDFISEACLPAQCPEGGSPLRVGEMRYDAVVVCGCRTLRATTLDRLEAFQARGGRLVFAGKCPDHVDGRPSDRTLALFARSIRVDFDRTAILDALAPQRLIDIRDAQGRRADSLFYQLRQDGDARWLFVANGKNPESPDVDPAPAYRFILEGEYALTEYDTLTGNIRALPARCAKGQTVFERVWHLHDSLLLRLAPGRSTSKSPARVQSALRQAPALCLHQVDVSLDEPNMLLLDMAEFALNGGAYRPLEEILRIDDRTRAELGIPLRCKAVRQPYTIQPEAATDFLDLRFTIPCECGVAAPLLALEEPENARVRLNGAPVPMRPAGWYVDRDIVTIPLPPLRAGDNRLEIRVPIGRRTNTEAFYLLGDFGVRVNGVEKTVTPSARRLGFGSVVPQGLPFYTGNVTYSVDVETAEDALLVRVPHYRGALVKVLVDGEDRGDIAFSPYELTVEGLAPGRHRVALKLYGTRQNGFAQLHHAQSVDFYQNPRSWHSQGDQWCYEYQLKPMGILKSPEFYGARVL